MRKYILSLALIISALCAEDGEIKEQTFIKLPETNLAVEAEDSKINYFKHYQTLPSNITMDIFKNKDMSEFAGKKLFIGYGTADETGDDCRVFPKEDTGYENDTTICLPYWRIEREYIVESQPVANLPAAVEMLPESRPPILVKVCDKYADEKEYPGGNVACYIYYDKLADEGCMENPIQEKCKVTNCTDNLKEHCTFKDVVIGEIDELPGVTNSQTGSVPEEEITKVNLSTVQYVCPSGPLVEDVECVDEKQVMMFPAQCSEAEPTAMEGAQYEYCDKTKPIRGAGGDIVAFEGTCKNGKSITCETKVFSTQDYVCKEPIYEDFIETMLKEQQVTRSFSDHEVDWISAEPDMYSERDNCLRLNSILDSREQDIFININASGKLDDDVYILRHSADGDHSKIYCNMQHAPVNVNIQAEVEKCLDIKDYNLTSQEVSGAIACDLDADNLTDEKFQECLVAKNIIVDDANGVRDCVASVDSGTAVKHYSGSVLSCLRNNGSYSVDMRNIPIDISDLVTIQQNSEWEYLNPTPFSVGRNHYSSTKVNLNGKVVSPQAFTSDYPYYPSNGGYLRTWDNVTSTLTILFPFAGIYELYFYNKNGEEIFTQTVNPNHFKEIQGAGYTQLKLGEVMNLAPGVNSTTAARDDDWVEIGGGVFGGRGSKSGVAVSSPNDSYVKTNAITSILVKDLIMGTVTPIPMVYPMAYPNRIYLSKLDVYEKRKYRCYYDFPVAFEGNEEETRESFVCENDPLWVSYKNDKTTDISGLVEWNTRDICEQNCRELQHCQERSPNDYFCSINGYQSSTSSDCESNCYVQNLCDSHKQSNCVQTQQELSHPVSDFTGKTLFTHSISTFTCEKKSKQYVGCAKYDIVNKSGVFDLNIGDVGVEVYKPASFEDVITKANMLDMPLHIWSGWDGECHKGMKMDSSYLSDPMTLASYAMAAYSSYTQLNKGVSLYDQYGGQFSEWADGVQTSISDTIDEIGTSISDSLGTATENLDETIGFSELSQASVDNSGVIQTAKESINSAIDSAESWLGKSYTEGIIDTRYVNVTNGALVRFGIDTAMIVAAPTEDNYELAKELIDGMAGVSASSSIVAYNSCMASIGLSMPNLVSWSMADINTTSVELIEPYKNPIRMTPEQLATIARVYGEEWVTRSYMINEDDPMLLNVAALTPNAYIEAGKTICAGAKTSAAMNQILGAQTPKTPPTPSGGKPMALSVGMAALSAFSPVAGFAATIVVDLYTNMLTNIDTCVKEDDAMAFSMLDYKTNLFLNHEQCVHTATVCTKKAVWGECVQHRYDYCCYDSILTRVFAQGIKEQTGKGWSSCNDLTIADLKNISFRECEAGEEPNKDQCFSMDSYSEFKQVLFRQASKNMQGVKNTEGITNHMLDAMSIP
ncbi:MAG: conjugal transfer protein TraN [Campylobacterales bacterium]|nr:conjugal transfer protein TraN [Campylobacterales bacterium]